MQVTISGGKQGVVELELEAPEMRWYRLVKEKSGAFVRRLYTPEMIVHATMGWREVSRSRFPTELLSEHRDAREFYRLLKTAEVRCQQVYEETNTPCPPRRLPNVVKGTF